MKYKVTIVALLISACLLITKKCSSQISDFTIDSCYFAESIDIIERNFSYNPSEDECLHEFGYLDSNELIVFGIATLNTGQHDAGIVNALDTTGLFWDGCHYHFHVEDWNRIYLLTECNDTVARSAKVGWNLQDGSNFVRLISDGYISCTRDYLEQFGAIDYTLASHPPNDDFNGDTRMGISAGFVDSYSASTWGNSIRINGIPNGNYYLLVTGNYSRYFNQGLNVFPDFVKVGISITGAHPNRAVSIVNNLSCTPLCTDSIPETISATVTNGFWGTREIVITDACVYPVTRHLVNGNKIQNSGVALNVSGGTFIDTNAPSGEFFVYRQGGKTSNKVKFR